jgi:hypothetical protein
MRALNRRELLQRGAPLAGGLGTAQLLAACGGSGSATTAGDVHDLASALRGELVLPGSPTYDAARRVWNSRFDGARPLAIARVADAGDVRTTVDFARDHGLRLIARSGAHSFAGYSTGDGLVVDLSGLTAVNVDSRTGTARLGAGSTVLLTYEALWRHRLAIDGGTCPTVGITGLTCGGGLGVLSRRSGATCDGLVEAEIITADGRLQRANRHDNEDLYWAIRGGGGGNFGVITALTFETIPVDTPFTHAHYVFPWKAAERVFDTWQQWLPTSPREAWSVVEVLTQAPQDSTSPLIEIEIVEAGDEDATRRTVADLLGEIGTAPVETAVHTGPFVDTEYDFYCKGLKPKECSLAGKTPTGKFPRAAEYAKSDVARGPWPAEGVKALMEGMRERQQDRTLTPPQLRPLAHDREAHHRGRGRRGELRRPRRDRVRAPRQPVRPPVPVALAQERAAVRCRGEPRVGQRSVRAHEALPLRIRVPGLHRPGAHRLAAGVLRLEPRSASSREGEIRPKGPLPIRSIDPARRRLPRLNHAPPARQARAILIPPLSHPEPLRGGPGPAFFSARKRLWRAD